MVVEGPPLPPLTPLFLLVIVHLTADDSSALQDHLTLYTNCLTAATGPFLSAVIITDRLSGKGNAIGHVRPSFFFPL